MKKKRESKVLGLYLYRYRYTRYSLAVNAPLAIRTRRNHTGKETPISRTKAISTALAGGLLVLLIVFPSYAFAEGGKSIAEGPAITSGALEAGNMANGQYLTESCDFDANAYRSYWNLSVAAGDVVTISWEGSRGTELKVMPVGTTDFTLFQSNPVVSQELSSNGKNQDTFTATTSGVMPLYFRNCVEGENVQGLYAFIATVAVPPPPAPTPPPVAPAPRPPAPSKPAPAPKLPTLTSGSAAGFAAEALRSQLASQFEPHRGFASSCDETGRTRQKCDVAWQHAGRRYAGHIVISYAFEGTTVIWTDTYVINRREIRCIKTARNPGRCPATTFRR